MRLLVFLMIRVIVLALSFIIATFAAALFITFVLFLGSDASWLQEDPLVAGGAILFAGSSWLQIATLAFAPAAIVMVGMELGRFSSLVANLVAGGACAAFILVMNAGPEGLAPDLPYEMREIWLASLAAGFVAGLSHWLLVGHRAGRWMGQRMDEEINGSR